MVRFTIVALLSLTALAGLLLAGVGSGLLATASLSKGNVLLSLFVYGGLSIAAVWIGTGLKRKWRQALLLMGALVFMCAAMELCLRLVMPHLAMKRYRSQRSVTRHHEMPASATMYKGHFEGRHIFVRTNEDGLRSDHSRSDFLQSDVRVVILGDSFTFGLDVEQERAFPQMLEAELRRATGNARVSVLNAGIISYSPLLEEILYRQVIRHYRPHLVVLMLDATDIGDDLGYARSAKSSPQGTVFTHFGDATEAELGDRCALVNLARPFAKKVVAHPATTAPLRLWECWRNGPQADRPYDYYDFFVRIGSVGDSNRFFIYRFPLELTRPYFDASMQHLTRLAEECRKDGAQFILVPYPRYQHWNPLECPKNWERETYRVPEPYQDEFFRYFDECAGKVDFPIHSLLAAFRETDRFPLCFTEDPHWNEAGHQFVAETLAQYLLENATALTDLGLKDLTKSDSRPPDAVEP